MHTIVWAGQFMTMIDFKWYKFTCDEMASCLRSCACIHERELIKRTWINYNRRTSIKVKKFSTQQICFNVVLHCGTLEHAHAYIFKVVALFCIAYFTYIASIFFCNHCRPICPDFLMLCSQNIRSNRYGFTIKYSMLCAIALQTEKLRKKLNTRGHHVGQQEIECFEWFILLCVLPAMYIQQQWIPVLEQVYELK